MTHQQMIDFWEKEIQKHESAQKFLSSTLQIDRHKALEMQARNIYMQLCTMETFEPVSAYFSDFDCVNYLHKVRSSYYVRVKGWDNGVDKICNPPTKEGYYCDEYMSQYRLAISGLPF